MGAGNCREHVAGRREGGIGGWELRGQIARPGELRGRGTSPTSVIVLAVVFAVGLGTFHRCHGQSIRHRLARRRGPTVITISAKLSSPPLESPRLGLILCLPPFQADRNGEGSFGSRGVGSTYGYAERDGLGVDPVFFGSRLVAEDEYQ